MRFYRILSIILLPLITIYMLIRFFNGKESIISLCNKFTIKYNSLYKGKTVIWFHAASVGEVYLAIPIIKMILKVRDDLHILITTTTITSAKIFQLSYIKNTTHQFLPLDVYYLVSRFLNYWNPKAAIFIESEIWPNLVSETTKRMPLFLLNARMSYSSFTIWKNYNSFISSILQKYSLIFPASKLDYAQFSHFTTNNLKYYGHFKYSSPPLNYLPSCVQILTMKLRNKNVFAAVSTHAEEEKLLIKVYKDLKKKIKNLFIIIVPRHPKRLKEIILILKNKNINFVTDIMHCNNKTELLILGAFGILGNIFEVVEIVFVGGSFVNIGGHNIIEPAKQNCAIIVGPYTANFKDLITDFNDSQAIVIVKNYQEFRDKLFHLFTDPEYKIRLIKNSTKLANKQPNILKKIVNIICKYINQDREKNC